MSADEQQIISLCLGGLIEHECITLSQSQKAKYSTANHHTFILLNEKSH